MRTFFGQRWTNKTVRHPQGRRYTLDDLPDLRNALVRAPLSLAKAKRYVAWENTRELHHGSASGTSRQRQADRVRGWKRREKKKAARATVAVAKDDWKFTQTHAKKAGYVAPKWYTGMGYK